MRFIHVKCLSKWKNAMHECPGLGCTFSFPDTEENRELLRPIYKQIVETCPHKDKIKGDPEIR